MFCYENPRLKMTEEETKTVSQAFNLVSQIDHWIAQAENKQRQERKGLEQALITER